MNMLMKLEINRTRNPCLVQFCMSSASFHFKHDNRRSTSYISSDKFLPNKSWPAGQQTYIRNGEYLANIQKFVRHPSVWEKILRHWNFKQSVLDRFRRRLAPMMLKTIPKFPSIYIDCFPRTRNSTEFMMNIFGKMREDGSIIITRSQAGLNAVSCSMNIPEFDISEATELTQSYLIQMCFDEKCPRITISISACQLVILFIAAYYTSVEENRSEAIT